MLEFRQNMWCADTTLPNEFRYATTGDLDRDSIWCDQPNLEGWLGEAWASRRTDDWGFFSRKTARNADSALNMSDRSMLIMHSLNHMLLYANSGLHPLLALDQLTDEDMRQLGGFTLNFKNTFKDYFPALHTYWRHSAYAPHEFTDTQMDYVWRLRDSEFWWQGDFAQEYLEDWMHGDSYHLADHCGAPCGLLWRHTPLDIHPFRVEAHQPQVLTVTGFDYSHWMSFLRNLETTKTRTLVKYNVENPPSAVEFTLGFFLLDSSEDRSHISRNRVSFIPDAFVPHVMDELAGWKLTDALFEQFPAS